MLEYLIEDASKELTIARSLKNYKAPFKIIDNYRLIDNGIEPEATVQIEARGKIIHEASTGNGPVDALAKVLKKGLTPLFPAIENIKLVDFRADILDARRGTSTVVQVTIIFTDTKDVWKVSSLSENINYASFNGLIDGFEYAIIKKGTQENSHNP